MSISIHLLRKRNIAYSLPLTLIAFWWIDSLLFYFALFFLSLAFLEVRIRRKTILVFGPFCFGVPVAGGGPGRRPSAHIDEQKCSRKQFMLMESMKADWADGPVLIILGKRMLLLCKLPASPRDIATGKGSAGKARVLSVFLLTSAPSFPVCCSGCCSLSHKRRWTAGLLCQSWPGFVDKRRMKL